MDRYAFLSCQTFLYPISTRWINSVLDNSLYNVRNEVLLANYRLSIEATYSDDKETTGIQMDHNNHNNTSGNVSANESSSNTSTHDEKNIGPCFFLKNAQKLSSSSGGFDCALSNIELTLYTADLLSADDRTARTPVKDSNNQERTLFGAIYPTESDDLPVSEAVVIAKIDGCFYQLDLNRLQRLQSIASNDEKEEGSDQTDCPTGNDKPSCLMLQFPSCLFRIFLSKADETGSPPIVKLDAIQAKLESLMVSTCLLPFPLNSYEKNRSSCIGGKLSQEDDGESQVGILPNPTDYGTQSLSRRRLQSHFQCWNDVNLLERVLSTPLSPKSGDVGSMSHLHMKALKANTIELLGRLPRLVSDSYMYETDLAEAVELCDVGITRNHDEIDEVFQVFWFPINERPNKRRRSESRNGDSQYNIQQNCINQTKDVLRKHKELLGAKYQLAKLPVRG